MIVIGTTIAAFAMSEKDAWSSWLLNADQIKESHGGDVHYFAAIEVDGRGIEPFAPLIEQLEALGGSYWTYSLDDGRQRVDMTNRWRHITFGQNMVFDFSQACPNCTHVLFLAADTEVPGDILPRMLEMNHPICAPYITTYGLRGEYVPTYPFPVEAAMASAAAIFVARSVFRKVRWRWDLDDMMSDDPCFWNDTRNLLGIETHVRHDVRAKHHPEAIGAYETRFDPNALEIHW